MDNRTPLKDFLFEFLAVLDNELDDNPDTEKIFLEIITDWINEGRVLPKEINAPKKLSKIKFFMKVMKEGITYDE